MPQVGNRECVIVRAHDPSPAQAMRVATWAKECYESAHSIKFVIQLDNTTSWRENPDQRRSRKRTFSDRDKTIDHGAPWKAGNCGAMHQSPPTVSPTHRLAQMVDRDYAVFHRYDEAELLKEFPYLHEQKRYLQEDLKVSTVIMRSLR